MATRHSRQREFILHVLRESESHPTADGVYDEVRRAMPHIGKGTVYRNLRYLCDSGEISELDLSGSMSRFDGRQPGHYHFRCQVCGRIFDLDEPVNHDLDTRIAESTGFEVACHHLEFRGRCSDCNTSPRATISEKEEGMN